MAYNRYFKKTRFTNFKSKQTNPIQENTYQPILTTNALARLVKIRSDKPFSKKAVLKALASRLKWRHVKPTRAKVHALLRRANPLPIIYQWLQQPYYKGWRDSKKAEIKYNTTPVFWSILKGGKNRSYKNKIFRNTAVNAMMNTLFTLSVNQRRNAVRRYTKRKALNRWAGAYIWAFLSHANLKSLFLKKRYTMRHPRFKIIKKQLKWKKRQEKNTKTLFRKSLVAAAKTGNYIVSVTKSRRAGIRVSRQVLSTGRRIAARTKQQAVVWRRVVSKRSRHWKYKVLQYKLRSQAAQGLSLRAAPSYGGKFKRSVFKEFRVKFARSKTRVPLFMIRDFAARDKTRLERAKLKQSQLAKLRAVAHAGNPSRASFKLRQLSPLKLRALALTIVRLENPRVPRWKRNQNNARRDAIEDKALAIFNKAFPQAVVVRNKWKTRHNTLSHRKPHFVKKGFASRQFLDGMKRRLSSVRWFKLKPHKYNLFKPMLQWKGFGHDKFIHQHYSRLNLKRQFWRKYNKKGYTYPMKQMVLPARLPLQRAVQKVALQARVSQYMPISSLSSAGTLLTAKPVFFSLYKASKAFDFNKFFRVNKNTARVLSEVSNDLYTHYLSNLQSMDNASSVISSQMSKQNVHTARVLNKYIQLLRKYFQEVYDAKLVKKIPAASAMHWVREYLRLTSDTRRRVSLWNRFNHVSFHFRPKAKEDDKRGRKKKILFKVKILFDRLFKWLYEQPNARHALASPIQKGVVRDYIVRNQFIFKKHFKVKLTSKLSVMLESGTVP